MQPLFASIPTWAAVLILIISIIIAYACKGH
jgi:hypothetical protein